MKKIISTVIAMLSWALLGGEAHALSDGFDYAVNRPVPSPWVWSVVGGSTNKINWVHELQTHYSGSGNFTISRSDVAVSYPAGGGAVYSIQMWDPGTQDLGVMFQVFGPNGWVAIGVNNNVANGKYYFRTNANNGNTGTVIPALRTGASGYGDWHTFEIYVREDGAYPLVDGIPISNSFRYAPMTSADRAQVAVNSWDKPANDIYFDNFGVTTISCPYLTCGMPQIEIPIALYASNRGGYYTYHASTPPTFPDSGYYPAVIKVTRAVTEAVQGYTRQSFTANYTPGAGWDSGYLYDSSPNQQKELLINYTCRKDLSSFVHIGGEALGQTTPNMDCIGTGPSRYGTISYVLAIYADNVGATTFVESEGHPYGAGTSIKDHCLGFGVCEYFNEMRLWGEDFTWDPARNKQKNLWVIYKCSGTGNTQYNVVVPPEANHRSFRLDCNDPH